MMEPTWIKLVAMLVFVVGILWFMILQVKIAKPIELEAPEQLPDESEVIGKELPVGFRFLKDGVIIEVAEDRRCYKCIYDGECSPNNKCTKIERPTYQDSVIFEKQEE